LKGESQYRFHALSSDKKQLIIKGYQRRTKLAWHKKVGTRKSTLIGTAGHNLIPQDLPLIFFILNDQKDAIIV
jgi:hypothetical protein